MSDARTNEIDLYRVGSRIYFVNGTLETDYKTINKAKRASREWQKSGKILRLATKPPLSALRETQP
jgi:hypothetical protein